jgi:DNA-binding response OmpR family regulator
MSIVTKDRNPGRKAQILLVDDDERLAEMVTGYLGDLGLEVHHEPDAPSGIEALRARDYDALILDIMMPGMDGFEACRLIRAEFDVPILFLSARQEDMDRIVGLELGADDYLPKPFNPRELAARLRAILRRYRAPGPAAQQVLRFGRLVIDRSAREARLDGKLCDLTSHQFSLLLALAERAGTVLSRDQIMQAVRGVDLEAFDRSIDVHVSRIRAEIEEDPKNPKFIRTVRATGYVFAAPADRESER